MEFLSLLVLLLIGVLIGLLIWTACIHLWFGLPYVPTPEPIVDVMVDLAELQGDEVVMDLGAGDARILISAKHRAPGIHAIGYELVPTIWLLGRLNVLLARLSITWLRSDALLADVSGADVIFLYVTPTYMMKLEEKFSRELQPGTRVISHAFSFRNRNPLRTEKITVGGAEKIVRVYEW